MGRIDIVSDSGVLTVESIKGSTTPALIWLQSVLTPLGRDLHAAKLGAALLAGAVDAPTEATHALEAALSAWVSQMFTLNRAAAAELERRARALAAGVAP